MPPEMNTATTQANPNTPISQLGHCCTCCRFLFVAFCLFASFVIIKLTNKDGTVTEIKIPEGTKIEIIPDGKSNEERDFEIAKGVHMKFCWVPAGKATLGTPIAAKERDIDEIEHAFETRGFWLGKYEVTQEQWTALMDNNPSQFKGGKMPVETVSWDDCQAFITKCAVKNLKVRLPHEDEWEYACRGGLGNKQAFHWGDTLNGDKANCNGTYPSGTETKGPYLERSAEVGSYERHVPHPWGLCDLHGNVSEWCDNLHSKESLSRVVRGGGWISESGRCRSAVRNRANPTFRLYSIGFRLALVL